LSPPSSFYNLHSECGGDSKTSDVLRGDEQAATFGSESLSTVTFSLGPITDSGTRLVSSPKVKTGLLLR
jgi:hypothetical protein